jgi:hypothetical protein
VLIFEGKCSYFRVKPARLVGHLPVPPPIKPPYVFILMVLVARFQSPSMRLAEKPFSFGIYFGFSISAYLESVRFRGGHAVEFSICRHVTPRNLTLS